MICSLFYFACLKHKQIRYHIQRNSHGRYRYLKCTLDVSSYNGYFPKRVKTGIALICSQGCPLSRPLLYWYRFLPFTLHELGTRKAIVCLVVVFTKQNGI
jgi:hypothetical protein